MFKFIKDWLTARERRKTAQLIESGKLPRGRTGSNAGGPSNVGGSVIESTTLLTVKHIRGGKEIGRREVVNRVVTDAGVAAIVDNFMGTFDLATFNYHDCGTGVTAEAAGNTALQTPVTEARVAGTKSKPTANKYQSVATFTFSNSYAITEHGLFSQSAKPGGTLYDRSVFAAVNVISGDSIQFTFDTTFNSGS